MSYLAKNLFNYSFLLFATIKCLSFIDVYKSSKNKAVLEALFATPFSLASSVNNEPLN
jgi:hypothetical protein